MRVMQHRWGRARWFVEAEVHEDDEHLVRSMSPREIEDYLYERGEEISMEVEWDDSDDPEVIE